MFIVTVLIICFFLIVSKYKASISECLVGKTDRPKYDILVERTVRSECFSKPEEKIHEYNYDIPETTERKKKANTSEKECIICTEKVIISDIMKVAEQCDHEDNMCQGCINEYITLELLEKGNINVLCPEYGCRSVLQEQDIKRFASVEAFERYQKLTVVHALSQVPDFHWCSNSNCNSGQIHFEGDNAPIMNCNSCDQKTCTIHDLPIHTGRFTCTICDGIRVESRAAKKPLLKPWIKNLLLYSKSKKENQRLLSQEAKKLEDDQKRRSMREAKEIEKEKNKLIKAESQSKAFMLSNTKECPKCKSKIQKDGGCDHMTCRKLGCGYEFCWICLADFNSIRTNGNKEHMTKCKYYA